ncbi:hypothetical protein TNCV_3038781 [Trichonephila clavipes]|nr:hypothetical protein TNCV_3038781 [Trichonephila clavipes]
MGKKTKEKRQEKTKYLEENGPYECCEHAILKIRKGLSKCNLIHLLSFYLWYPAHQEQYNSGRFIQEVQPSTPSSSSLETSSITPFTLNGVVSSPHVLELVSVHL